MPLRPMMILISGTVIIAESEESVQSDMLLTNLLKMTGHCRTIGGHEELLGRMHVSARAGASAHQIQLQESDDYPQGRSKQENLTVESHLRFWYPVDRRPQ